MHGGTLVKSIRIVRAILISAVLGASAAFAAGTTSPGKNAVYASADNVPIPSTYGSVLSATIEKGKKKRVLEIDLVATNYTDDDALVIRPVVNGLTIAEPKVLGSTNVGQAVNFCSGYVCTTSGQWWLDLDAAEASNPGMFIGQPLVIDFEAGDPVGFPGTANISIRARMQKK